MTRAVSKTLDPLCVMGIIVNGKASLSQEISGKLFPYSKQTGQLWKHGGDHDDPRSSDTQNEEGRNTDVEEDEIVAGNTLPHPRTVMVKLRKRKRTMTYLHITDAATFTMTGARHSLDFTDTCVS